MLISQIGYNKGNIYPKSVFRQNLFQPNHIHKIVYNSITNYQKSANKIDHIVKSSEHIHIRQGAVL